MASKLPIDITSPANPDEKAEVAAALWSALAADEQLPEQAYAAQLLVISPEGETAKTPVSLIPESDGLQPFITSAPSGRLEKTTFQSPTTLPSLLSNLSFLGAQGTSPALVDGDLLSELISRLVNGDRAPAFPTVAAAAARDLSDYSEVIVNRWSAAAPFARATYLKRLAEPTHDLKFQDDGGNWWGIDTSQPLTPQMAGALCDYSDSTGTGSDDTAAFVRLANAAKSIFISRETTVYLLSAVFMPSNVDMFGGGRIIAGPPAGFNSGHPHCGPLNWWIKTGFTVENITFDVSKWRTLPPGAASTRNVLVRRSSNFSFKDCRFITTGGSVATIGCSDFAIKDNVINVAANDVGTMGFADGVIDNWVEWDIDLARFKITGNRIYANGHGLWGIMITGDTYTTQQMDVKGSIVSENYIENTYYDGIWAFGRDAILDGINVINNIIDTCRTGISISDATNANIQGNTIKNATQYGMEFWKETASGGVAGVTNSVISGNKLHNVATTLAGTPPAIYLRDGATRNIVEGNSITGTGHYFGIYTDTTSIGNLIRNNLIDQGRSSRVSQGALGNLIDGAGYSPTLTGVANVTSVSLYSARFNATQTEVVVHFRILVTPTAGSTVTDVGIQLPVASDIIDNVVIGVATGTNVFGSVFHDSANDRALLRFTSPSSGAATISGSFNYPIR